MFVPSLRDRPKARWDSEAEASRKLQEALGEDWNICDAVGLHLHGGFTAVLVQAFPFLMLFPWCCGLKVCVPLPSSYVEIPMPNVMV